MQNNVTSANASLAISDPFAAVRFRYESKSVFITTRIPHRGYGANYLSLATIVRVTDSTPFSVSGRPAGCPEFIGRANSSLIRQAMRLLYGR